MVERPFSVHELDHVVLRCRDRQRMERFYADVLGLVVERRLDAIGLVQLRAGRSLLDLIPGREAGEAGRNVDHFCLGVDAASMDSVERHLRGCGVEVAAGPVRVYGARGMGTSIYVRDPEGNTVELKRVGADA